MVFCFGGKSGTVFHKAKGMNLDTSIVREWFEGRSVEIIKTLS